MIKQQEIQKLAELYKVPKSQLDKDWVLGYLLYSIITTPELKNKIIFKGGTCLKKCYFPDYRFSEDLDFTLLDSSFIFDKSIVHKIINNAGKLSFSEDFNRGILFKLKAIEPTLSNDVEQGYKIHIYYWGADHRKNDMPAIQLEKWHHTIKLDINHTENIFFTVNKCTLIHNFSDKIIFNDVIVPCYSIEEILSEKLRALLQRKYTSPRDCYDIWYLNANIDKLDWDIIKQVFIKKCEFKDIVFKGIEQLINPKKERILKQHWQSQLMNQFPANQLPDFEIVISDLKQLFANVFTK